MRISRDGRPFLPGKVPGCPHSLSESARESLPAETWAAVADIIGGITAVNPAGRGPAGCVTAAVGTEDGQHYFVKAVPEDSPAYPLHEREHIANAIKTLSLPAPGFAGARYAGGWLVLVFEYLAGRPADLSPGSRDIRLVSGLLRKLSVIPAWEGTPPVAEYVLGLQRQALPVRKLPYADQVLYVTAADRFDIGALAGDTVIHGDLGPGSILVCEDGIARAVGWAQMCRGARWIDTLLTALQLISAGHSPEQAEHLMSGVPAWKTAPTDAVTGLTAWWTRYREAQARHGPERDREPRERAAQAGDKLLKHRMKG